MPLKFYLHAATTGDTGTLPGAATSISATTPTQIASGTNRSLDDTIGTAQTSVVLTTLNNTSAQASLICRFLSVPIAAQTIAAQNISLHFAFSESNANSNFGLTFVLGAWRPGTGTSVGRCFDISTGNVATTSETATSNTPSSNSLTVADGDVLDLEIWRDTVVQGMATAYSNTFFFDGTTEDSATTNAAYLLFTNDVALFTAAGQVPYVNYMPQLLAQ